MNITLTGPADGHYTQIARVEQADGGALLFRSAQIAEGATLAEQTRGVFEAIGALPASQGASLADVVSIRTYLTDISGLDEYSAVRREFLTGTPPTSMTFEVPRLFRSQAMVEVEVVPAVVSA